MARTQLLFLAALLSFVFVISIRSFNDAPWIIRGSASNLKQSASSYTSFLGFYESAAKQPKNAFCVFLAEPNEMIKPGQEDVYFIGVRMLVYQLLHDPATKTSSESPNAFVVLVAPEVTQEKRAQLEADGAIVQEVEHLHFNWIKPGRPRWAQVMDKLAVFRLTQYEKVLLLDTDMVVTGPLDGVFDDPATVLTFNHGDAAKTKDDEGPQPSQFIMAGNRGGNDNRLNAGFVVLRPSMEMYEHYVRIANIEGRFPGGSPEQDLWNYVHRQDGNMPWTQIDPKWTINSPTYEDFEKGVVTFHEKYWRIRDDLRLRDVLLRSRWKMEGFFKAFNQR